MLSRRAISARMAARGEGESETVEIR